MNMSFGQMAVILCSPSLLFSNGNELGNGVSTHRGNLYVCVIVYSFVVVLLITCYSGSGQCVCV